MDSRNTGEVLAMDFRLTPEQEAFRTELETWLDRNAVEVFGEFGAAAISRERRGMGAANKFASAAILRRLHCAGVAEGMEW
jgi:hypothetical protein